MGRTSKHSRSQVATKSTSPLSAADSQRSPSSSAAGFRQPSNLMAFASVCLAVFALIVSMRGCQLASDAHELAQRQYREDRQIVLDAVFAENGDSLTLRSIGDASNFLEGRAYFPTEISKEVWPIQPSDKKLYLVSAKFGLQESLKKRVPHKSGFVQVSTDGRIPLLIESRYASRGEVYLDRSIYLLATEFVVGEDPNVPPMVKLTGLTFLRRLDAEQPVDRKVLDEMFNSEKGIYAPGRTPR